VESDGAVPLEEAIRQGIRSAPDVSALASREQNKLWILVWHYHDDDVPGPEAEVELALTGQPVASGDSNLRHFRIDEDHSNAFAAWKRMGSPPQPTAEQYAQLQAAGQLTAMNASETVRVENGRSAVKFKLPRQGLSLLELEW